jgi:trehalose-6-phosphate synthase
VAAGLCIIGNIGDMNDTRSTAAVRLQAAEILDAVADCERWNHDLYVRFDRLVKQTGDEIMWHAYEELGHYSGEFNSFNIFFVRVKPDAGRVSEYKRIFRSIAEALRNGKTFEEWDAVENAGVYKPGDFTRWLKRWFSKQPTE